MTYSVEKSVVDVERDSISVPRAPEPVGDVTTSIATVTITSDSASEPGPVEVYQPVPGNVLNAINLPVGALASSTIVSSPVSSTSSSSLNYDPPAQVDNHASLSALVTDDDHPCLGVTHAPTDSTPSAPSGMSSDVPLTKPIQSVDLDSLDFSKVPAWLRHPLAHLQKDFRGELEDKILGSYVALEMAWHPVSAPLSYFYSNI